MKHTSWLSGLSAVRRPEPGGLGPHLGLGQLAHGEAHPRQLGLAEHVQHVGLVLGRVGTAAQTPLAVAPDDSGVVAGGDGVEAQLVGPAQEAVELEVAVALDARVGRAPGGVGGDVRVDHVAVEVVGEVEDVVGDAELLGHPAGVLDVGHRAAARVAHAAPQLHGGADHVVALLEEQGGRHRRVDPARHGDEHRTV